MLKNSEKIYKDSYGLWISALFSAISGNNPELSFSQQKEEFFSLLRTWLNEGKIFFCAPDSPLSTPWKAGTNEIIAYLGERWPASAETEDDADLNLYFYEIPAVLWLSEDGELMGS